VAGAIGLGFLVVLAAVGILVLAGRRKQAKAKAQQAERAGPAKR
jgi:hypothetical protein